MIQVIRYKFPVVILASALAVPSMFAQGPPPDAGQGGGPHAGPGAHRQMGPGGPGDGPGGWRRGEDGERGEHGWRRGRGFRGMHGHRRERGEFGLARLVQNPELREKLGITSEQAAKISQQTAEFHKSSIRSRADLLVKHVELGELLRAETPDRVAIDRKLDEIAAARAAEAKAQVHYRLAMREALTPKQQKKLREMRQERMRGAFRGQRREGPPRGPRGPQPTGTGEE